MVHTTHAVDSQRWDDSTDHRLTSVKAPSVQLFSRTSLENVDGHRLYARQGSVVWESCKKKEIYSYLPMTRLTAVILTAGPGLSCPQALLFLRTPVSSGLSHFSSSGHVALCCYCCCGCLDCTRTERRTSHRYGAVGFFATPPLPSSRHGRCPWTPVGFILSSELERHTHSPVVPLGADTHTQQGTVRTRGLKTKKMKRRAKNSRRVGRSVEAAGCQNAC